MTPTAGRFPVGFPAALSEDFIVRPGADECHGAAEPEAVVNALDEEKDRPTMRSRWFDRRPLRALVAAVTHK